MNKRSFRWGGATSRHTLVLHGSRITTPTLFTSAPTVATPTTWPLVALIAEFRARHFVEDHTQTEASGSHTSVLSSATHQQRFGVATVVVK